MGIYLTPHEAIEHHQRRHVSAESDSWSVLCTEFHSKYGEETTAAETVAKEIIFKKISSLEEVSWASFFTRNRTGVALYVNSDTSRSEAVAK